MYQAGCVVSPTFLLYPLSNLRKADSIILISQTTRPRLSAIKYLKTTHKFPAGLKSESDSTAQLLSVEIAEYVQFEGSRRFVLKSDSKIRKVTFLLLHLLLFRSHRYLTFLHLSNKPKQGFIHTV
jgi:hypothetical protein